MSLQDYTQDVGALLRDNSFVFNSETQVIRWINEARRRAAKRTGCIQRLITGQSAFGASAQPGALIPGGAQPGALPDAFPGALANGYASVNACQTIPGVERYPFQGFFNKFAQAQHAGIDSVIDVVSLSVSWGGTLRPSLDWMPFEDLQAYARSFSTLNSAYPCAWSVLNDGEFGEVYMYPVPSVASDIEAQAYCTPKALYTNDDFDAIPPGFRDAIKFLAASLAFASSGRFSQAQYHENQFAQTLGIDRVAADMGKTSSFYNFGP